MRNLTFGGARTYSGAYTDENGDWQDWTLSLGIMKIKPQIEGRRGKVYITLPDTIPAVRAYRLGEVAGANLEEFRAAPDVFDAMYLYQDGCAFAMYDSNDSSSQEAEENGEGTLTLTTSTKWHIAGTFEITLTRTEDFSEGLDHPSCPNGTTSADGPNRVHVTGAFDSPRNDWYLGAR